MAIAMDMIKTSLDEVITVAEAVQLTGLNVRMIQRMCKSDKLIARQDYKGNWLILKSSVEAYKNK
jgi:hypothetical protein